jgi:hypothetical protein
MTNESPQSSSLVSKQLRVSLLHQIVDQAGHRLSPGSQHLEYSPGNYWLGSFDKFGPEKLVA